VIIIHLSSLWQHNDRSEGDPDNYVRCSMAERIAIPIPQFNHALAIVNDLASFLTRHTSVRVISDMEFKYQPSRNAGEFHFTIEPALEASSKRDSFESDLVKELLYQLVASITILHTVGA
jgi:hypothetical protein